MRDANKMSFELNGLPSLSLSLPVGLRHQRRRTSTFYCYTCSDLESYARRIGDLLRAPQLRAHNSITANKCGAERQASEAEVEVWNCARGDLHSRIASEVVVVSAVYDRRRL